MENIKTRLKEVVPYISTTKKLLKGAHDIYTSRTSTYIKNKIRESDKNARRQYRGENHAIVILPNGKIGISNFLGNGTHIIQRLKSNDPPRTYTDSVARSHDIAYALSTFEPTQEAQLKDIRLADNEMINKLRVARKQKADNLFNISIGLRLIQSKKMLEDIGVLHKDKFIGKLNMYNKDEKKILLDHIT